MVQSGCPTSIGSGVQLPPRELLLIRRQNDWFVCHSDKVEVVGSTPTLRTTFMGCQAATAERVPRRTERLVK